MNAYEITNLGDGYRISLRGEVGYDVLAERFAADLEAIGDADFELRVNSPGGSVYEGGSIIAAIREHRGKSTAVVEALAASMATAICCACDRVVAHPFSQWMIHEPSAMTAGDAEEHRRRAGQLDQVRELIVDIYVAKTGRPRSQIEEWLRAETWMTPSQALEAGFIDQVLEVDEFDRDLAACLAGLDLSRFQNPPEELIAMTTNAKPTTKPNAVEAAVTAERTRVREIRSLFGRHPGHDDLFAKAIDEGWSREKAATTLLDALGEESGEPTGGGVPRVHVQDRRSDFAAAALDTMSLRAGVKLERPHPATRDMGRMSMLDIATQCLRNVGINPDRMSATRVFNTAFTHTTSDFPGIAGDLFERILMTSYQGEPDTSAGWTVTSELRDFREVSRVRFSEAPDLEFVPEGAEITFASFNERVERYRLSTYARAFSVTRQLLLNDDLQAFADLPASFGRAARRRHLDNVWAVVTGNPAMSDGENLFSAAHGNDLTPAALSLESLTAARLAMRTMKGEAGKVTLNLIPRFLLVPASLEGTAEALVSSLIPPGSTTATPSLQFIRNLEVVCEPRLDEASTTAWYLACDPAQLQSIEQGFLGGVPFEIEEKTGFDVDGIAWKVRSDHAAAPLEWRSIVRNAGA